MNSQGKSVGPYELFAYLPGYGWDWFVDSGWTKLRGDGGVIEDAKEFLHDGYRVAMIVDSDGHATHMEYWGLAQPRTMKLEAGTYDFIEAQHVLFEARKNAGSSFDLAAERGRFYSEGGQ